VFDLRIFDEEKVDGPVPDHGKVVCRVLKKSQLQRTLH